MALIMCRGFSKGVARTFQRVVSVVVESSFSSWSIIQFSHSSPGRD